MRATVLLAARGATILIGLGCMPPRAQEAMNLYEVSAIVTGQREETRDPAIRQGLIDVLMKVSGDPRLRAEPTALNLEEQAASYVDGYRYHDRLSDRPIHDEQGTRDRPHDLTMDFSPTKIDALLRSLGREPWTSRRPPVAVFLAVRHGTSAYVMSADGERSYGQPDAFAAASVKTGVPLKIPSEAGLASAALSFDAVRRADPRQLEAAAATLGAEAALAGDMVFSDQDLGWIADWRMPWKGKTYQWRVSGVSYDEAFRNALRGAAQILSGHGQPE